MKKFLFLLIITSIISFLFQGKRGLWEPDEGRYAEVAREMVLSNNYLIPKLNLKTHLSKPPITYWAIALSMKIFGKDEFAVRLPNSIAFFFTVVFIFLIAKLKFGYENGIIAGLIYATSIFPFIGLNIVTTDTILTFLVWLYVFFYFKEKYILMWFAISLAFLTKGPPCFLPLLGIILSNLINKDYSKMKRIFSINGIFLFLIIGVSWYIAVIVKEPQAFDYFIKNELIGRIKGIHHRNSGTFDWLMYIPVLLFGLSPWIFIYFKKLKKVFKDSDLRIFYFIIFIPLIIFCFVKSRLPLYILPLMPAVAIILSKYTEIIDSKIFKISIITTIILIALRISAAYFPYSKNDKQIYLDLKKYIKEKEFSLNFVTTREWNGLNFYFNRIPEYLSLTKNKKLNRFSSKTVVDKLNEIEKTHNLNYILISDYKKIIAFENILNLYKGKLDYKKFKAKRFKVYRIK